MVGFIVFGIFAIAGYFLPGLIRTRRKVRSAVTITFVNFFVGWTGIGWLVVLFWAIFKRQKPLRYAGKFLTREGSEIESSFEVPDERTFKPQLKNLGWKPVGVQSSEKVRTGRKIFNALLIVLMATPFGRPYVVTGYLVHSASKMIPLLEEYKIRNGIYPERL